MYRLKFLTTATAVFLVAGCSSGERSAPPEPVAIDKSAPSVVFNSAESSDGAAKPSGPISVAYRVIGQPVIGQPLSIDLAISSSLSDGPIRIDYRIPDASALRLADSQTAFATVAVSAGVDTGSQQVTVVPLREGRLYLNVSATIDTNDGMMSTVTAIPIQVGDVRRAGQEHGVLTTDEDGNAVRVLSGTDD